MVAYGIILLLEVAGRKIICRSTVTIPDGKVKIPIMMAAPQTHHRQGNVPDLSAIEVLFFEPTFFLWLRVAHGTLKFRHTLYLFLQFSEPFHFAILWERRKKMGGSGPGGTTLSGHYL